MGTNCGPLLANLYLYAYESSFIDRLQSLSELGKETARSFHMTFRLIDDVFSVGNPVIHQYVHQPARRENDGKTGIGGLYPHELQLNDTNVSDTEVHFLGMTISNLDGSLELDIFDKKKAFPFRVIRYPHMDSVIPTNIPYGVWTGLLYRRYRICTKPEVFVKRAVELGITLAHKGCSVRRLIRLFRDFLQRQRPLRYRSTLSDLMRQFRTDLGSSMEPGSIRDFL